MLLVGRSTTSSTSGRPRSHRELPPELERSIDVGRIVRIGLVGFGVLIAVVAVMVLWPRGVPYGGPLQDNGLISPTVAGTRGAVGQPVSLGFSLAWNAAGEDAELDRLVPLAPTAGIEIVGAGILGPQDPVVELGGGYPPEGLLKPPPVRGYRIPPGTTALDAYQVVVGVEATAPGIQSIAGFEVQYHVGGASYRAIVLQGVWICVPRGEKPACPDKGGVVHRQEELRLTLAPLIETTDR